MVEQNRSQSTGPSTPYPSGPTTPMRGQASVAQYWVKHTRLDCVELLGPEACAVRTWWNDTPPAGTSTCTALLESKDGSSIADTKLPSLKWERIGCLWVPGTTWRQPFGERKDESSLHRTLKVHVYIRPSYVHVSSERSILSRYKLKLKLASKERKTYCRCFISMARIMILYNSCNNV